MTGSKRPDAPSSLVRAADHLNKHANELLMAACAIDGLGYHDAAQRLIAAASEISAAADALASRAAGVAQ